MNGSNKNYFVISVRDHNSVSHTMRKNLQTSFYGDLELHKYGQIDKFCKALGYFDVIDDIVKTYPVVKTAKYKSPDNYVDPFQLLIRSMYIDLSKNGYWTFYIPESYEKHFNFKYSYSSQEIAKKFYKFLLKVYPNLVITMNIQEGFHPQLKTCVLNFFYKSMDIMKDNYTVEIAVGRLLSNTEICRIETVLREMVVYPFHIEQMFCETCKGYDETHPYHVEIVYDT